MQLFKIMSQRPFFFSIIFLYQYFIGLIIYDVTALIIRGHLNMYCQTEWTSIFHCFQIKKCFLMYCNLLVSPRYKQDFISIMHLGSLVGENCGDKELKYSATSSLPVMLLIFSYQYWLRENKKKKTNESGSGRL